MMTGALVDICNLSIDVDRRGILRGSGGLVLSLALLGNTTADAPKYGADSQAEGWRDDPRLYVSLDERGDVTITCHRAEMGQGIRSSLAMVIADEMSAEWSRIRVEQAIGAAERYGNQNTDGSRSMRHWLMPMRRCGAAMRMMLVQAAAAKWSVPAAELEADSHRIVHKRSGRTVDYGALAGLAAKLAVPPRELIVVRAADALTMIGKDSTRAFDSMAITTGAAAYGIDATMPDMLFACIARPPVLGSAVLSFDDGQARAIDGVIDVVQLPALQDAPAFQPLGGDAVLARNSWAAMRGRDALIVKWTESPHSSYSSTAYKALCTQVAHQPGQVSRTSGDVAAALAGASRRVTADYHIPHLAHATMEPPSAVVRCDDTSCEAHGCVQDPSGARDAIAAQLKLDKSRIVVHQTLLGGGFGRKSKPDFMVEAALLSRHAKGRPVKILWTREDDIRHDYYHTVSVEHLEAALDKGRPTAWLHRSVAPSISALFDTTVNREKKFEEEMGMLNMPFAIPNVRIETGEAIAHTRIGWFRSVSNIPHAFAVQSFAAELAAAVGRDQKDYLIELLGPDRKIDPRSIDDANQNEDPALYPIDTGRLRRVIEAAADGIGWDRARPKGWGFGIACHRSFVSYTACAFAVSVVKGQLTIHRADIAIDCGAQVNPDRIRAQMEGSVMMGLGLALYGEISFEKGAVQQGSFDDYPVLRIDAAPKLLQVHLVAPDFAVPPGGVGEPGLPPVAPALCNAIFAATGKRIRALPIGEQLRT